MTVIGTKEGLEIEKFRAGVKKLVNKRFADKYGKLYQQIDKIQ